MKLIAPERIISRRSTETFNSADLILGKAIAFFKKNIGQSFSILDAARFAGVSRRVLERRFSAVMQRSPAEELKRLRNERAKQLLIESNLSLPSNLNYVGALARVKSNSMAKELQSARIPIVNISGIDLIEATFPRVTTDMTLTSKMAFEYLLERGFQNFAYFSLKGISYINPQKNSFVQKVKEAGFECSQLAIDSHQGAEPNWTLDNTSVVDWLQSLPKPVAIFTWNMSTARQLVYICIDLGLKIPNEVGILSGSEDDLLGEVSPIPISAVQPSCQMIGFRAMEQLQQLIRGGKPSLKPILIPPLNIITRQSTDLLSTQDPALRRAMAYLSENSIQKISVSDLARESGLSRRILERRFKKILKRTPGEEIRLMRLKYSQKLLAETDLPISEVASAAGFTNQSYLSVLFRNYFKMTPAQFKAQSQPK